MEINKKDISIRWYSGTGAGGQHRNRTQNCCEVTHLLTGFKASGTESRSRKENERKAMDRLFEQLQDEKKVKEAERINQLRKQATENGRIRTYDFKQGLAIDHRSGKTAPLNQFMDGKIDLTKFSMPSK